MATPEAESLTLDEYRKGTEALRMMEGWKIHLEMERLDFSFYIFHGNYDDLLKDLRLDYGEFMVRFDVRNREEMQSLLKEIMRKFHNFVASALMLVDHTRNLSKKMYQGTDFETILNSEIEQRFTKNPQVQFVHRLRSYILHCGLPEPSAVLSGDMEASFKISITELSKWNGWTKWARQYLHACNDNEKIEDIATAYYKSVRNFHEWFFDNQKRVHQQAFDETNALRKRLANSKWHLKYS